MAASFAVFLVLLGVVAAVAAALYVDFVHEHGPLESDTPAQSVVATDEAVELARRFAPVLRYDSLERFVPIPRSAYLGRTQLKEQEGRFLRVLKQAVDEPGLPESLGSCGIGCFLFLDVRGLEPDPPRHSEAAYDVIENKLLRDGARPTVYYHVTRYDDTGEYGVQFWFLYFFNYRLNEHESDWEQVTVRLDDEKKPLGVYYSAHEGGNTLAWDAIETRGDHPVDYPARGSHANYTKPGRHRVSVGCRRVLGSIKRCLRGRTILVDVSDGKGTELASDSYDLAELTGPIFAGSYGSGNYVVLTRKADVLSDPRRRTAWNDPLRPFR